MTLPASVSNRGYDAVKVEVKIWLRSATMGLRSVKAGQLAIHLPTSALSRRVFHSRIAFMHHLPAFPCRGGSGSHRPHPHICRGMALWTWPQPTADSGITYLGRIIRTAA